MPASVAAQFGWLAAAPQGGAGGLGDDLLSSGLIAMGVMLLIWLLLRTQWRRQREQHDAATPLEHMEQVSTSARQREREELAAADLVQLSRRVLAQIDARSAHLEALIADADDRIEQLRRLDGGAGARPGDGDGGGGGDRGGGNGRAREAGVGTGAGKTGERGGLRETEASEDPVMRRVYDLADRGLAPVEIARELDQHLGAVELILALRPR